MDSRLDPHQWAEPHPTERPPWASVARAEALWTGWNEVGKHAGDRASVSSDVPSAPSLCAPRTTGALEEIHPTVTLPTITVEARSPVVDPAFEINSVTVLDRDTLARSKERELNLCAPRATGVTRQSPGQRGNLSTLFLRGASARLGQLSFDGVPAHSSVNGIFNLSTIPADALERIDIIRGASGLRYGSPALGASYDCEAAMPGR